MNRRRVFFATSFSGHVDYETGEVHEDFRERLQELLITLRSAGFDMYCAVESEGWKIASETPGKGMARNFAEIDKCDVFLALVDKAGSDGRGVEIEHAYNEGKQVILITGSGEELGWVMQELVALGRVQHIHYDQYEDLAKQLTKM